MSTLFPYRCMKKTIASILVLLCFSAIQAQTVSTDAALASAKQFLAVNEPSMAGHTLSLKTILTDSYNNPSIYVFNIDTIGFILMGTDKSETPVIGYSFNGAYEPELIPNNLGSFLQSYIDDLQALRASVVIPDAIASEQYEWHQEWNALMQKESSYYDRKNSKSVSALIESRWDQGPGYNNYCPTYTNNYTGSNSNGRCLTGCVATAMAQIIRYHQYPTTGFSYHSYTHPAYGSLRADFDSTVYNYNLMPNRIYSNTSAANQNAVSLLCYHCGVAVNMTYEYAGHTTGSGAHSSEVPNALKHFGYFNTLYLTKTEGNTALWDSLLHRNLDMGNPVYYSGSSSSGGHAFVCDGYTNNNYYHFNFGWSGYTDGNYSLSSLNGYSSSQAAVFNIIPSHIGPVHSTIYVAADGNGDGSSWQNATSNLNCAMQVCGIYKSGQLWVKKGTYYGDTTSDAAFIMQPGIKIYGGFAGNEQSLDDRVLGEENQTFLSGDNKRRVILSQPLQKSSTFFNITFTEGYAETGSALSITNNCQLENCIIENNSATDTDGAAIHILTSNIIRCIIRNNHCGGVILKNNASLKNSLIVHNDGFGVKPVNGKIDGCDIVCNSGTGVVNDGEKYTLRNSVIWRNGKSLRLNDIKDITFCAIEGFGSIDSNSNFGISHYNRSEDGSGPMFLEPDTVIGISASMGNWRTSFNSPLVDAGDTNHGISNITSLDGSYRFRNGRADIGCYENDPNISISTPLESIDMRLYPNPTDAILYIESSIGPVEIYDAMGRRVLTAKAYEGRTILDVGNLPRGVYLLKTTNATSKFIKK